MLLPKTLLILATCVTLFILRQIQILHVSQISSPSPSLSWSFISHQWQTVANCTQDNLNSMAEKLRHSVTFLPPKDLRYTEKALQGHTWFMILAKKARCNIDSVHRNHPTAGYCVSKDVTPRRLVELLRLGVAWIPSCERHSYKGLNVCFV